MSSADVENFTQLRDTLYRVLKRCGFKGSKNQVAEKINTFANYIGTALFFREIFSSLGFALHEVKNQELENAFKTQSLFLQTNDHQAVEFKYKGN